MKALNTLANYCKEETEAGGRIPSSPQTAWRPSHPPAGGQWRGESAKPRHLGASSPSGNVRGECRGWTPLDQGRKIVEW
jgi:hypothetical protein